jgi:hypothetical protein
MWSLFCRPEYKISILLSERQIFVTLWERKRPVWVLQKIDYELFDFPIVLDGVIYNMYKICSVIDRSVSQKNVKIDACCLGLQSEEQQTDKQRFQSFLLAHNIGFANWASFAIAKGFRHDVDCASLVPEGNRGIEYLRYRHEIGVSLYMIEQSEREER